MNTVYTMNKKRYENQSKRLFVKWKAHNKNKVFVMDGIINYNKWIKSNKILIILKEPYTGRKDWYLPDNIDYDPNEKDYEKKVEWRNNNKHYRMLAMWLYCINHSTENYYPKKLEEDEIKIGFEYLLSSAIINIKKNPGKSTSNNSVIQYYSEKDRIFLKKQIEIISPKIIYCGNTCHSVLTGIYQFKFYNELKFSQYCFDFNGITFIDYYHPSRKNGKELEYCRDLSIDYQKYLKNKCCLNSKK